VTDRVVHPEGVLGASPYWWACREPERPHDRWTAYDIDCQWCMTKARLTVDLGEGEMVMANVGDDGEQLQVGSLRELMGDLAKGEPCCD
jgi:hypothetical protein